MASFGSWFGVKNEVGMAFPNLPYFCDTDGFKLSECMAIHMYIADKWNPELLGRNTEEKAEVDMLQGVIKDIK
jgi:glutathione S-transferase